MQVRYQLRHRPRCCPVEAPDNSFSLQHDDAQVKSRHSVGRVGVFADGTVTGSTGQSFHRRSSA